MVENDRSAFAALEAARERIGARTVDLVQGDALHYLAKSSERFDVVFLDPPFRQNALPAVLAKLEPRLAQGARVYIESDAPASSTLVPGERWTELRRDRAGQVSYQLFEWRGDDQGGIPRHV
jgi:16S rRNA (guanine966-N2)-methyltransferase